MAVGTGDVRQEEVDRLKQKEVDRLLAIKRCHPTQKKHSVTPEPKWDEDDCVGLGIRMGVG